MKFIILALVTKLIAIEGDEVTGDETTDVILKQSSAIPFNELEAITIQNIRVELFDKCPEATKCDFYVELGMQKYIRLSGEPNSFYTKSPQLTLPFDLTGKRMSVYEIKWWYKEMTDEKKWNLDTSTIYNSAFNIDLRKFIYTDTRSLNSLHEEVFHHDYDLNPTMGADAADNKIVGKISFEMIQKYQDPNLKLLSDVPERLKNYFKNGKQRTDQLLKTLKNVFKGTMNLKLELGLSEAAAKKLEGLSGYKKLKKLITIKPYETSLSFLKLDENKKLDKALDEFEKELEGVIYIQSTPKVQLDGIVQDFKTFCKDHDAKVAALVAKDEHFGKETAQGLDTFKKNSKELCDATGAVMTKFKAFEKASSALVTEVDGKDVFNLAKFDVAKLNDFVKELGTQALKHFKALQDFAVELIDPTKYINPIAAKFIKDDTTQNDAISEIYTKFNTPTEGSAKDSVNKLEELLFLIMGHNKVAELDEVLGLPKKIPTDPMSEESVKKEGAEGRSDEL